MKKITILGSTGSIGTQTLDIIRENPELYRVEALACGRNIKLLAKQIAEFKPAFVSVTEKKDAESMASQFPETKFLYGKEGLIFTASQTECDMLVNALVGMSGLEPTYYAIQNKKTIALANKETLVAGGALVMSLAEKKGTDILPVDSEHSAVFQCLKGYDACPVERIILTASGGPFRGKTTAELEDVTLKQALNHPRWSMGSKITIDSSTLMNKGFEVIEAKWLFNVPADKIDVVVHPESIIHSMVEFEDHAVLAQLGIPDMRIPISFAMAYPDRLKNNMKSLDFASCGTLTFEKPDFDVFKCLKLAYDALKAGGTYCTALNAANEVCVDAFLHEKISYMQIQNTLEKIMNTHIPSQGLDLDEILYTDGEIRKKTENLLGI